MTWVRVVAGIPTVFFQAQQQRILQALPRFQTLVLSSILPASQARTDATINQPLGAHQRPTDWQTPRQRRWWWAVGIHLWHGRKDKQDWGVRQQVEPTGGRIVAVNPMPGARYVFVPPYQQRMHTGVWMTTTTYAAVEAQALLPDVRRAWIVAAKGAVI